MLTGIELALRIYQYNPIVVDSWYLDPASWHFEPVTPSLVSVDWMSPRNLVSSKYPNHSITSNGEVTSNATDLTPYILCSSHVDASLIVNNPRESIRSCFNMHRSTINLNELVRTFWTVHNWVAPINRSCWSDPHGPISILIDTYICSFLSPELAAWTIVAFALIDISLIIENKGIDPLHRYFLG
jgi:hypothetical protein